MGVKIRQWKGAWWIFINHHGMRKARRVGIGELGNKLRNWPHSRFRHVSY